MQGGGENHPDQEPKRFREGRVHADGQETEADISAKDNVGYDGFVVGHLFGAEVAFAVVVLLLVASYPREDGLDRDREVGRGVHCLDTSDLDEKM